MWIYKWTPIAQDTIEILLCGSEIQSFCGVTWHNDDHGTGDDEGVAL